MEARNLRKERTGVVLSDKMDKTITVAAKFKEKHPFYKFLQPVKPDDSRIIKRIQIMLLDVVDIRPDIQRRVVDMLGFTQVKKSANYIF